MQNPSGLPGSRATARMAALLLLPIIAILAAQYALRFPLESMGSPSDILSLVLGLLLAMACFAAGLFEAPGGSASRWAKCMAGLFLGLAVAEYFFDAGPVDIPIAVLWLAPALILALGKAVPQRFGPARLMFAICAVLQAFELCRSILSMALYGGANEPALFSWIENASDLLVRGFFLLGFSETIRARIIAPPLARLAAGWRRQRIAIFMNRLSGAGAQLRSVDLANGLIASGYDVDMAVLNGKSPISGKLSPGVRFIALNQPPWSQLYSRIYDRLPNKWVKLYGGTFALAGYLKAERPDMLVGAANRSLLVAVLAWRLAGKPMPLVLRATNFPTGNLDVPRPVRARIGAYMGMLARLVYRPATAIVPVSDGVGEEIMRLTGVPRSRITRIYEPVVGPGIAARAAEPLDHPWAAQAGPPLLLAIGALRLQKDYPTLLRAFALLRR